MLHALQRPPAFAITCKQTLNPLRRRAVASTREGFRDSKRRVFAVLAAINAVVVMQWPITSAVAQQVATIPFFDAPEGTPALAAGVNTFASPYAGDNRRSDLVPLYLYQGKRFFSYGTEMGVHLFSNDRFYFDAVGRYRFNRLDQTEGVLEGVRQREQSIDGGLRFGVTGDWGDVSATWVTDLRNRHQGSQFDLDYEYRFDLGRWSLAPWVSIMHQDQNLANYYYGVSEPESRASETRAGSIG